MEDQPYTQKDMENLIYKPFTSFQVSNFIMEKIMKRTYGTIYSHNIDDQLKLFSIKDCFQVSNRVLDQKFKFHDPGENQIKIPRCKSRDKNPEPPVESPNPSKQWLPSNEPEPAPIDNCARHKLRVKHGVEFKKGTMEVEEQRNYVRTYTATSGKKLRQAAMPGKDLPKPRPDSFPLRLSEETEPDENIAKMREKKLKEEKEKKDKRAEEEKKRIEKETLEMLNKKHQDKMKNKDFTYDFEGKPVYIQPLKTEQMAAFSTVCSSNITGDNMSEDYNKTKASWKKKPPTINPVKTRRDIPQDDREFASKMNRTLPTSNFEIITPNHGVTITESGKTKMGGFITSERQWSLSEFKARKEGESTFRSTMPFQDQIMQGSIPISQLQSMRATLSPKDGKDPNISKYGVESITEKSSGAYGKYMNKSLLSEQGTITKTTFDTRQLLIQESRSGNVDQTQTVLPQLNKIKTLKRRGHGTMSETSLRPTGLLSERDRNQMKTLFQKNEFDMFNMKILNNAEWSKGKHFPEKRYYDSQKKANKPKVKDLERSLGKNVINKKFPRERNFIEKTQAKSRLAPPPVGQSFGHGIILSPQDKKVGSGQFI